MTEELFQKCKKLISLSDESLSWIKENQSDPAIKQESSSTERALLRNKDHANIILNTIKEPMTAGVFGASQSGKSFLINQLTRGNNQTLNIILSGETLDFLTDINPDGNNTESTGLVTRFTASKSDASEDYPVTMRLLSQTDLIKVLINAYFNDFNSNEEYVPNLSDLTEKIQLAKKSVSQSNGDITDRDVDSIFLYVEKRFKSRRIWERLKDCDYWIQLEELLPKLDIDERINLLAPLWGNLEEFSTIYREMYLELRKFNFNSKAYCTRQALIPREDSIINVKALLNIGSDEDKIIDVKSSDGQTFSLKQSVLAVIIKELVFQIPNKTSVGLEVTDLLDFPGARSRHNYQNADIMLKNNEILAEVLLRGKVAYLFERYTEDYSINGLILCVVPGNNEVTTVPNNITPWVESLHGETAQEREGQVNALFMALTKFDNNFQETLAGDGSDRWKNAIQTTLIDLFGQSADWVNSWTEGKAFDNVFWLRNPAFINHGLMTYDGGQIETGLSDGARIQEFKLAYLATSEIQKFVKNYEYAFDEALKVNDGGVSYLVEEMSKVFKGTLKNQQIELKLKQISENLQGYLERFFIQPNDSDLQTETRLQEIKQVQTSFVANLKKKRFGYFLDSLMIAPEQLNREFMRTNSSYKKQPAGNLDGIFPPDIIEAGEVDNDELRFYGAVAQEFWLKHLDNWLSDKNHLKFLGLNKQLAAIISREVREGIMSEEVTNRLDERVNENQTEGRQHYRPASICTDILNDYILTLGQKWIDENSRPKRQNSQVSIFPSRPRIETLRELSSDSVSERDNAYLVADWSQAMDNLVRRNCSQGSGRDAKGIENLNLGKIITELTSG